MTARSSLSLTPIGIIRTPRLTKFDAPNQPEYSAVEESTIELFEPYCREALRDLDGFSHLWLLWWFDKNTTWRPMVRPPRGDGKRRGVFATRSPHRPNPLGLTAVRLHRITSEGRVVVGANDLVDSTPIFDIKPYLPGSDSFPEARTGWLETLDHGERYDLVVQPLAEEQLQWLALRGIEVLERAGRILRRTPFPHRTRRITRYSGSVESHIQTTPVDSLAQGSVTEGSSGATRQTEGFRMGCGPFRLYYTVTNQQVAIHRVGVGYSKETLEAEASRNVPARLELLAFLQQWPTPS